MAYKTNSPMPTKPEEEMQLMSHLWSDQIKDDPYAFVMFVFPWGKPGTILEHKKPYKWQVDELKKIAAHVKKSKFELSQGKTPELYRSATCSGRGPGKSAFLVWLTLWQMSCHLGSTTIIAANSEDQLKTKTWAELAVWHTIAINEHWFDRTTEALVPSPWFKAALDKQKKAFGYYYARAQLWSEENPDSFAGAHNPLGLMVLFDEASGIPEPIWAVTTGYFTDISPYRFFFAFSNPRRNTGAFFKCFNEWRDMWNCRVIDSRSVEGADVKYYNSLIKQYEADSDHARIEVYGEFPRQGDKQFISSEIIKEAVAREVANDEWAPLIMGVDPARFGDDSTVIRFRQGRNGRIIEPVVMRGVDNMAVANRAAHLIDTYHPDAVCVDVGNGSGVIDRLREMKYKIFEVGFGTASDAPEWANKRTELWARMKDWLPGGCIDNDPNLIKDLNGPHYDYMGNTDKVMLEPKEKMKKRGVHSPDHGDALALTFAVKVARKDNRLAMNRRLNPIAKGLDYDIFGQ